MASRNSFLGTLRSIFEKQAAKEGERPRIYWLCNLGYKFAHSFLPILLRSIPKFPPSPSFLPQAISKMTTPIRILPGETIRYYSVSRIILFTTSTDCWGHRGVCDMISSFNGPSVHIYVASIGFVEFSRKHPRQLRSRHARWCGRHRKRYLQSALIQAT